MRESREGLAAGPPGVPWVPAMCEAASNAGLLADATPAGVRASCRPILASLLLPWTPALAAVWGTGAGLASSLVEPGWAKRGVPMGVLASLGPPGEVPPA